jgi:hypothetical protein
MLVEKFEVLEKKVDTQLAKYPIALQAERRLGHPKTRLLLFSLLLLVALIVLYLNPDFAYMLIATVMPSICTVRLLQAYNDSALGSVGAGPVLKGYKAEMWMAYWLIFSKLLLLETLGLTNFLPMYSLLRIIFVVWLQAPGFEGAQVLYEKAMLPAIHFLFKSGSSSSSRHKGGAREKKAEAEEKSDNSFSSSPSAKGSQMESKGSPRSNRKED